MSKFNVVHPSCKQDRYEAQNDGNDWHTDENDEPIKIVGFEVFDKLGLDQPQPQDIPDFKTERAVNWVKVAKEASYKDVLADGGEAALLKSSDSDSLAMQAEALGGDLGIKR